MVVKRWCLKVSTENSALVTRGQVVSDQKLLQLLRCTLNALGEVVGSVGGMIHKAQSRDFQSTCFIEKTQSINDVMQTRADPT